MIYLLRRCGIRLTACDILLSQSEIFAFANVYRLIIDVPIFCKINGVSQSVTPYKRHLKDIYKPEFVVKNDGSPLTQQNLRTVREAGPYSHRDRLCKIIELYKPEFLTQKTSNQLRLLVLTGIKTTILNSLFSKDHSNSPL